jgi:hypothetical protein
LFVFLGLYSFNRDLLAKKKKEEEVVPDVMRA